MEDAKIQLTCKIDKVLNYAMIYNGFPIIHDICIKNTSDIDLQKSYTKYSDRQWNDQTIHSRN